MAQLRLHVREADGRLPMFCMRCGEPATVVKTKKMSWYPRWIIILILVNLIICAIVALIMTKRAVLQAPLCDLHKGHWFNRLLILWGSFFLLVIFCIGLIVLAVNVPRHIQDTVGTFAFIGGAAAFLGWLIMVAIVQNTAIRPAEITDRDILLEGVSQVFIDALADADHDRDLRRRRSDDDDYDYDEPKPRKKRRSDAIRDEDRPRKRPPPPPDAIEE